LWDEFLTALPGETFPRPRLTSPISHQRRSRQRNGLIGAAFGLGFIFGPAIGGILSLWGTAVPFFFARGLCFANAALLYFTLPETVTPDHPARTSAAGGRGFSQLIESLKATTPGICTNHLLLLRGCFSMMTTTFSLYTMFRFGYDAQHNGYLFAYVGVIAVLVQGILIGRLVKRFGELALVVVVQSSLREVYLPCPLLGRPVVGWWHC